MTTRNFTTPFTRSTLFTAYNRARQAARTGKLEQGRVNRALGILQSRDGAEHLHQYEATVGECWCKDASFGRTCKHRIARMIEHRAGELVKGA